MALLDVTTDALFDPNLTDTFMVKRRAQTVDDHGRSVEQVTEIPSFGVVTATSPNDLSRPEDYEMNARSITIVCKFRLRGVTTGNLPDIVYWRGSNYVVKAIDNYPQFGSGFIQAECTSMDRTDGELVPPAIPEYNFSNANNSFLIGI